MLAFLFFLSYLSLSLSLFPEMVLYDQKSDAVFLLRDML